jgi:hypothetical protein
MSTASMQVCLSVLLLMLIIKQFLASNFFSLSRTFICTGTCPYGERCVFLHDPRIESNCQALKARLRKTKEELFTCPDSFFWQTMPRCEVLGKLDGRNRKCRIKTLSFYHYSLLQSFVMPIIFLHIIVPAISQHYIVPHPSSMIGLARDMRNNDAVYSLWSYFLDFLVTDPASVIRVPRWSIPIAAEEKVNKHTGKRRLNLFVTMSEGKCVQSDARQYFKLF